MSTLTTLNRCQSRRIYSADAGVYASCFVYDFWWHWDSNLPLIDFSYNRAVTTQAISAHDSSSVTGEISRQKKQSDKRRILLNSNCDQVLLKVSPWKGVVRFGKKGKLAPRYVGPFEIVERVGPVAYRARSNPSSSAGGPRLFHVSEPQNMLIEKSGSGEKLKRRRIPLVKVRWNSRQGAEYTWENEDQFRKKYLHLFSETVPPSGVAT
ncbi:hypothetical protein Tco_0228572 [Tanacetum coccineum]